MPRFSDLLRRPPFPRSRHVISAEQAVHQIAEGELAVVAVGKQDEAAALACEAEEIRLRTVAVPFLEKSGAVARLRLQSPAHAVSETNARCFVAIDDFTARTELCSCGDPNLRPQHFGACRRAQHAITQQRHGERGKVLGG